MKKLLFILFLTVFLTSFFASDEARLLRFPTVHEDQIVFTYAGNLYTVSTDGGTARKLTSHNGVEIFPRFSNDGKSIAFTGQYDGNTEVYIMPADGGVPKRLTYTATLGRDDVADRMGPNNLVMGWTRDDQNVIFRSRMKEFNSFKGHLFLAPVNGDVAEQIPLPRGGFASYSPDGNKLTYNRVFREFRTWKRYRGGMADDVWIYDFNTKETSKITNNPAQDIIPMWSGNKIYFLSDRDKTMNLFVYDLSTEETKKLTNFTEFDIKFPSLGNNAIVFENGGYIYHFDLATETAKKLDVQIAEDLSIARGGLTDVSKRISNYEISPDGNRALLGARGELFTVPAENGITRNLSKTSGVHERNSKWSPDGKYIAYISDKTGEDEIYIVAQDGSEKEIQLTEGGGSYKFQLSWSPDSEKILFNDRELNLKYVNVESKEITTAFTSKVGRAIWGSWSPDSKWIAFSKPGYRSVTKVALYSLADKKVNEVTGDWYSSFNPSFSSDGKFLVFTSARDFNPSYSWTEWNHAYFDMIGIYMIPLSEDTKSPFEPENDEVKIEPKKKEDAKSEEKTDEESKTVNIDFENIAQRILKLPIEASSYFSVKMMDDKVYYIRNGSADKKPHLYIYDLEKKKETQLGAINGYEISADGKKMLVGSSGKYYIISLPTKKISLKKSLNLSGLKMNLDRKAEWEQIFNQAWRQMRDFFYVPNMHGVNWLAVKQKYEPLLDHVSNRIDLSYIIGEMIGELNVGHAYVSGGDYPKADRVKTGLLGAKIARHESGYYKIDEILEGRNWDKKLRSPLTEIGVNANEGDFIISVNGVPTNKMTNIYESLYDKAGKQVSLKINNEPKLGGREVTVIPRGDEADLYYFKWVQNNIQKVTEATNGKVGYIHVPDMGRRGLNEFMKHFYPQLGKKALIIDVRGNGGGNVSPMLIERLRRDLTMMDNMRNSLPTPDPSAQVIGPKVCLLDEFSASDGDLFPYRFRKNNLGKLIGKRSWGGVVGISGSIPYVDGGSLNVPEYGTFDAEGKKWIIEGRGVEPDIFVDNDPALEYEGVDQQLQRAIDEVLKELESKEFDMPSIPPYPVKN